MLYEVITFLLRDARLDAPALSAALLQRREDLASPMAALVEQWLPRDPTLLALDEVESWMPATGPELREGVWFSHDGRRALQVVSYNFV